MVNDIGLLDDRAIALIMAGEYSKILAEEKFMSLEDFIGRLIYYGNTPFAGVPINYCYGGTVYHYSSINYISWGFLSAHIYAYEQLLAPLPSVVIKRLIPQWSNLYLHNHFDLEDQTWFNYGYDYYRKTYGL